MSVKQETKEALSHGIGRQHMSDRHRDALWSSDLLFGACCIYMAMVGTVSWLDGEASVRAPIILTAFMLANLVISQFSLRAQNAKAVEVGRAVAGSVLVPLAYLWVDGPLYPWWPGAIIMALGSTVLIGLLTQKPFWGRVAVVYYSVLLILATWLGVPNANWYDLAVQVGVLLVVGLMFAQIMALLGQSLAEEQDRSKELASARDALFAEMEIAQEIQTLLLPKEPNVPDNVVEGQMIPADEVGGDYYDVIEVDNRGVFLAIGDVSGHGVTSGLTMMMARASLMGALEANPSANLTELYQALNRCLCKNLKRMDVSLYMTFALLEYVGNGQFRAVGRHLPMVIYRSRSNEVEEVELQGMWLGVISDLETEHLPQSNIELDAGDLIFLYTDGIVEQEGNNGEMYGFDRLKSAVHQHASDGARHVIQAVMADLKSYADEQEDDITMLAINHVGQVEAAALPGRPAADA